VQVSNNSGDPDFTASYQTYSLHFILEPTLGALDCCLFHSSKCSLTDILTITTFEVYGA